MADENSTNPDDWLDAHGDALYRYALLRLRDRDRAEEAVQEAFVAALQAVEGFAGNASVRTWLIGILRHKITDQFRRAGRETPASELEYDPDGDPFVNDLFDRFQHWKKAPESWKAPDQALEDREFWAVVDQCMGGLSGKLADVFALRLLEHKSTDEICKILEITATNLGARLYRARLQMRQCLERNWFGQRGGKD